MDRIVWVAEDRTLHLSRKNDAYELHCEYLSGFDVHRITVEIESLERTRRAIEGNNKDAIEEYFVHNLMGFHDDDLGRYAYVAGPHDFFTQIRYDWEWNTTYLKHIYGADKERIAVALADVIGWLKEVRRILESFEQSV